MYGQYADIHFRNAPRFEVPASEKRPVRFGKMDGFSAEKAQNYIVLGLILGYFVYF